MKPLTNPEYFTFTNHFNQSMLKRRVQMMNRRPSSCNAWRYFIFGFVAFSTMMCQPSIHSESITDTQQEFGEQKNLEVDNNVYETKTFHKGDTVIVEEYHQGKLLSFTKSWEVEKKWAYTWTGNQVQLKEASDNQKRHTMLYISSDNRLALYEEFKNDIDIFVDGERITQTDLSKIQINHISKIYAHKREEEIPMIKLAANNVNTPQKNALLKISI
ncbi:hypothetical protein P1X15_04915 [Runella sp. MFBS21]|uniref:hypothetical protein n=1 Tax=Runella sp. MFBS21 TaxID=3034018 RepID=UPI0023F876C5|nr:hypothetical protein [Runella sp. MFBS21]MDF7816921.1 hypothetical protein [Runella sp. MFBS21]